MSIQALKDKLRSRVGSSSEIQAKNIDVFADSLPKLTKFDKELDKFMRAEEQAAAYKTFCKENEPWVDSGYFLMARLALTKGVFEEINTTTYSTLVTKTIPQEWRTKNKAILHPIQICVSCGKVWDVKNQGQVSPLVDTCRRCFNNSKHLKNLGRMHHVRFIGYLMTHVPYSFYTFVLTDDDRKVCADFEELNPHYFDGEKVPSSVIDIAGIYGSI